MVKDSLINGEMYHHPFSEYARIESLFLTVDKGFDMEKQPRREILNPTNGSHRQKTTPRFITAISTIWNLPVLGNHSLSTIATLRVPRDFCMPHFS